MLAFFASLLYIPLDITPTSTAGNRIFLVWHSTWSFMVLGDRCDLVIKYKRTCSLRRHGSPFHVVRLDLAHVIDYRLFVTLSGKVRVIIFLLLGESPIK
jgi:hypothetical protein